MQHLSFFYETTLNEKGFISKNCFTIFKISLHLMALKSCGVNIKKIY